MMICEVIICELGKLTSDYYDGVMVLNEWPYQLILL
jgi:hypothetical protein